MAVFDELMSGNEGYAASFDQGDAPGPPAKKVAILTCMDARLHPEAFLGLGVGDAHVIRNAGGRATDDVIRSLAISQRLLGTEEVIVLHHTDCGMLSFRNVDMAAKVRQDLGVDAGDIDFLPFDDLDDSVREDVTTIRDSGLIPDQIPIIGAIYDVKTGRIREVGRE